MFRRLPVIFSMKQFSIPSFTNPEYELVALHPKHFLPLGVLTVHDPATKTNKNYFAARDQCLRESPEPDSPRFPAFHHKSENRPKLKRLNVFLVILNAGTKFRRYFEIVRLSPPATPLPDDVLTLMRRTIELIDLIYWKPVPTTGSRGEAIIADVVATRRRHQESASNLRSETVMSIKEGTSQQGEDEDVQNPSDVRTTSRRRRQLPWPADADLETRMAYGRVLMSGHGELFFASYSSSRAVLTRSVLAFRP
jgi:hypothetical protein